MAIETIISGDSHVIEPFDLGKMLSGRSMVRNSADGEGLRGN